MKQHKVVLLVIVLAVILFSALFLFRFTHTRKVMLPLKTDRLMELLIHPTHYHRWMNKQLLEWYKQGSLDISTKGTAACLYRITRNDRHNIFLYTAVPGKKNEAQTDLALSFKVTAWQLLTGWNEEQHAFDKSFTRLEELVKSPLLLYGYDIHPDKVVDSTFIYHAVTTSYSNRKAVMQRLFETLIAYAKERNAGYTGTRIFHFTREGSDSIRLYGSIGILRPDSIAITSPYPLKRMPYGKNLLAAPFEGPYMRVEQVYRAMERYKSDKNMVSMAIPYHKLTGPELSLGDSTVTRLEVYYPVY